MIQKSAAKNPSPKPTVDTADFDILSQIDPIIEVGSSFSSSVYSIDHEQPDLNSTDGADAVASFDLGEVLRSIPAKLFFRIGEVAELLQVKPYVLRFWETEFTMIHPTKSKTGQRVYRKQDVETLVLIKHLLYVERYSIEGAVKRIKELKRGGAAKTVQNMAKSGMDSKKRNELRARTLELDLLLSKPITEFFRY